MIRVHPANSWFNSRDMKHIEGQFTGVRNSEIYYQAWLPEADPKAVLLIVHGIGEHCGRYTNLINHLVPLGYAVYGMDHIGHGKSDGPRILVERFEDFSEMLDLFSQRVTSWHKDKPLFLLGHSLGGAIACTYLLDHPNAVKGAIFSAPAVKVGDSISLFSIVMSKLLSKIAPTVGIAGLDSQGLSRDSAVIEAYKTDPLVYRGKLPARTAAEILSAMQRITKDAAQIQTPLLILQGEDDILVDPAGARMLHEQAGSPDKTLKIYDDLYHEIFNEPERDRVFKDVENWLKTRIAN